MSDTTNKEVDLTDTVTWPNPSTCKCCGGTGVQIRNDGIKIKCPCCNGTGDWNDPGWKITWCPSVWSII